MLSTRGTASTERWLSTWSIGQGAKLTLSANDWKPLSQKPVWSLRWFLSTRKMCIKLAHLGCKPSDFWFVDCRFPAPTGVRLCSHFEGAYAMVWVESSIISCLQYYWHASLCIEPPVDDSQSCPSAVHCRVACLRSVETHLVTSWFVLYIKQVSYLAGMCSCFIYNLMLNLWTKLCVGCMWLYVVVCGCTCIHMCVFNHQKDFWNTWSSFVLKKIIFSIFKYFCNFFLKLNMRW